MLKQMHNYSQENLKTILLKQYELHQKMQFQDFVKLIYQNEFGGGHLIDDEISSLNNLKKEFNSIMKNQAKETSMIFENIGNGLYRLHLKALQNTKIDITTINKFFVISANSICGNIDSFEEKLIVLKQCCKDNLIPFSLDELENYLNNYKSKGYPLISHSDIYRKTYSPAYRIVKKEFKDYFEIFCKIDYLMKSNQKVNIAIDGNSTSGKTTLAEILSKIYDCNVFHMDDFFLRPEQRTKERLEKVGGNVDYIRFKEEIIDNLYIDNKFKYQIYDCKQIKLTEFVTVSPKRLNIIEGVYSMHPTLIDNYDLNIFLSIDKDKQSKRILKRNGPIMYKRFINEWIPMENKYFEQMKIREKSNIVL